jgi:hypothetical protein
MPDTVPPGDAAPGTPRLLEGKVAIITGATIPIDGGKLAAGA